MTTKKIKQLEWLCATIFKYEKPLVLQLLKNYQHKLKPLVLAKNSSYDA